MFKRKSIKPKLSIRDVRNLRFRYRVYLFRYYMGRDYHKRVLAILGWKYRTMIDAAAEIDNRPKNVYYNYDKR